MTGAKLQENDYNNIKRGMSYSEFLESPAYLKRPFTNSYWTYEFSELEIEAVKETSLEQPVLNLDMIPTLMSVWVVLGSVISMVPFLRLENYNAQQNIPVLAVLSFLTLLVFLYIRRKDKKHNLRYSKNYSSLLLTSIREHKDQIDDYDIIYSKVSDFRDKISDQIFKHNKGAF